MLARPVEALPGTRSTRTRWLSDTDEVLTSLAAGWITAEERPWTDIPVVRWVGLVIGAVFLWAAIRFMFGRRK